MVADDALELVPPAQTGRRPTVTFVDTKTGRVVRRCVDCKTVKPIDEFPPRRSEKRYGRNYYCRPCVREKSRQGHARYKYALRRFGMTGADFDAMMEAQGGRCALCGGTSHRTLHVDHCHKTGKVRGLLCHACNPMLGYAKEDPAILAAAIEYLRKHKC